MELSIFLAKIISVIYVVIGLGILFNIAHYHKTMTSFAKDAGFMYLSGIFALLLGTVLVLIHNNWVSNWTVIITVIGWLSLVKGVLLLLFPKMPKMFIPRFKKKNSFVAVGLISLAFGAIFGYFGFFL